mgnify:CR=1 FL=1
MKLQDSNKNLTKHKKLRDQIILSIVYMTIWGISVSVYWYFTDNSDAMGYSLIFLWIIIPCTTFLASIIIGKNNYFGRYKWISVVVLGIMYMLIEFTTFSTSNMRSFDKINLPRFDMILIGGLISFLGIFTGTVIRKKKRNKIS